MLPVSISSRTAIPADNPNNSSTTSSFFRNTFCPTVVGGKRAYCNPYDKETGSLNSSYYGCESSCDFINPTTFPTKLLKEPQTLQADALNLLKKKNNSFSNLVSKKKVFFLI